MSDLIVHQSATVQYRIVKASQWYASSYLFNFFALYLEKNHAGDHLLIVEITRDIHKIREAIFGYLGLFLYLDFTVTILVLLNDVFIKNKQFYFINCSVLQQSFRLYFQKSSNTEIGKCLLC